MTFTLSYIKHWNKTLRKNDEPVPPGYVKTISIRQPWAWLILHAGKNIENRNWKSKFRGRFLIHAAKGMSRKEYKEGMSVWDAECAYSGKVFGKHPRPESLERGGIVGIADCVDCVTESESLWFRGKYGFKIENPAPLPFLPLRGQLGFFNVRIPDTRI